MSRYAPEYVDPRDTPLQIGLDFMIRRGMAGYWYIADARGRRVATGIDFGTYDQAYAYASDIGYAIVRILDSHGDQISADRARSTRGVRH
jgi:hypothetical protein